MLFFNHQILFPCSAWEWLAIQKKTFSTENTEGLRPAPRKPYLLAVLFHLFSYYTTRIKYMISTYLCAMRSISVSVASVVNFTPLNKENP